jgi:hypothetical protein
VIGAVRNGATNECYGYKGCRSLILILDDLEASRWVDAAPT